MEGLLALLSRRERPTVLVLEDMQWADEATLDAITFLGRRILRTNGVVVLTYRDVNSTTTTRCARSSAGCLRRSSSG